MPQQAANPWEVVERKPVKTGRVDLGIPAPPGTVVPTDPWQVTARRSASTITGSVDLEESERERRRRFRTPEGLAEVGGVPEPPSYPTAIERGEAAQREEEKRLAKADPRIASALTSGIREPGAAKGFAVATREAAPYIAGAAGAIAVPAYPIIAAGLAGMGGEAVRQTGRAAMGEDVPTTLAGRTGMQVLRGAEQMAWEAGPRALIGIWNTVSSSLRTPRVTDAAAEAYLRERGLTMTAGEKAAPGYVATAEPVAARTAVASSKVVPFLRERSRRLFAAANELAEDVGSALRERGEQAVEAQERLGRELQDVGQAALRTRKAERSAMAQEVGGELFPAAAPRTAEEAGDFLVAAVGKRQDAIDAMESMLYGKVEAEAANRGISVQWDVAQADAERMLAHYEKAAAAGGAPIPPDLLTSLRKIAGTKISKQDYVAQQVFQQNWDELNEFNQRMLKEVMEQDPKFAALPDVIRDVPSGDFATMSTVRTSLIQKAQQLRRAGAIDTETLGALKKLTGSLTEDLMRGLPQDLRAAWQEARVLTTAQKEQLSNQFVRSLLRSRDPVVGQEVVSTLMRKGRTQDITTVASIVQGDPEARLALQRSAAEWVIDNASTAEKALQLLQRRPGIQQLLGPDKAGQLRTILLDAMRTEQSVGDVAYLKFLKEVTGTKAQTPAAIVDSVIRSPAKSQQLSFMLRDNPEVRGAVARDMFDRVLDRSTLNGPFGAEGAHFDPIRFHDLWFGVQSGGQHIPSTRRAIEPFLDKGVVENIDKFARNAAKLKLSHEVIIERSGSIAAQFGTLGIGEAGARTAMQAGLGTRGMLSAAADIGPRFYHRWFISNALDPVRSERFFTGLLPEVGRGGKAAATTAARAPAATTAAVIGVDWERGNDVRRELEGLGLASDPLPPMAIEHFRTIISGPRYRDMDNEERAKLLYGELKRMGKGATRAVPPPPE